MSSVFTGGSGLRIRKVAARPEVIEQEQQQQEQEIEVYVDKIVVAAPVTSVVFGAGGDGVLGTALDGDLDEEYILSTYIPDPVATPTIQLRPNSIDPAVDLTFDGAISLGGGGVINQQHTNWLISGQSSGFVESGNFIIQAASGKTREMFGQGALSNGTTTYTSVYSGRWPDTVTKITSLQIFSAVASAIKAGAVFKLWKRPAG